MRTYDEWKACKSEIDIEREAKAEALYYLKELRTGLNECNDMLLHYIYYYHPPQRN
jgi:hypothetical protein